jgi:hypothetical protein
MLCLKDGFEANGLAWGGLANRKVLENSLGLMKFITPGGVQSLTTITAEGFHLLVLRSRGGSEAGREGPCARPGNDCHFTSSGAPPDPISTEIHSPALAGIRRVRIISSDTNSPFARARGEPTLSTVI